MDKSRVEETSSGTGDRMTRREFSTAAAVAASATLVRPELVFGATANSKVRLGIIGCGGRGGWIADLFAKHGGYEVVAAADYFQDRVDAVAGTHNIPSDRRYTGLSCYKRLLESELDAVAIISPPYFHPEQAEAAVESGRHVYLAKPVAVDAPGCRRIETAGNKARDTKRVFLVDFQTRADPFYKEAVKRVHEGAIGDVVFGEARYHCGALGAKAKGDTPEARLRNWVFDKALSGDIITEQNIHSLDVMSWIMNKAPVAATGCGGRKVRTNVGDCWDHFAVLFQYEDGVGVTFSSKQYRDGGSDCGITADVFGTTGRIVTKYGGRVMITGKNSYAGGNTGRIYQEGAVTNIADFHDRVTKGDVENSTVAPSVRSNLVTIMGRTAAYEGRPVAWSEVEQSETTLDAKLEGFKD